LEPVLRGGMQMVLKMPHHAPAGDCSREWARSRRWHERCSRLRTFAFAAEEATFARILQRSGYILIMAGRIFLPQLVGPSKAAELSIPVT